MPNQTAKMQFNTFLENDVVDWELINQNFEKLDDTVLCIESGEKTAAYSGGSSGNAVWYYKIYSDGSLDMYTILDINNLRCSNGGKIPYYSDKVTVNFPFKLNNVNYMNIHVVSDDYVMVSNVTQKTSNDIIVFRLAAMESESNYKARQIYIEIKGRCQ